MHRRPMGDTVLEQAAKDRVWQREQDRNEAARYAEAPQDLPEPVTFEVGDIVYVNNQRRATYGKFGIVPDIDLPDEPGYVFVCFDTNNEEVVALPIADINLECRRKPGDIVYSSRHGWCEVERVIYRGQHFPCDVEIKSATFAGLCPPLSLSDEEPGDDDQ